MLKILVYYLKMDTTCNTPETVTRVLQCLQNPTSLLLLSWVARVTSQIPPLLGVSVRICWDGCKCHTFFCTSMLQHHTSGALSIIARDWTTVLRLNSRNHGRESECHGWMWPFFSLKEHFFINKVIIQPNVAQLDNLLIVHYIYLKTYS